MVAAEQVLMFKSGLFACKAPIRLLHNQNGVPSPPNGPGRHSMLTTTSMQDYQSENTQDNRKGIQTCPSAACCRYWHINQ
jgi:hypothetical protein